MSKSWYEFAMKAIRDLFNDTSVSADETRINLNALKDEIDVLLSTLPD